MKIKKKVIFGMIAGLFAVATVINMQMENTDIKQNIPKENIMAIANAGSETAGPLCAHVSDNWCVYKDGYRTKGTFRHNMNKSMFR